MEWLAIVSLTVGIISIILAGIAIWLSTLNYERTKDVLAKISEKAAVIEGTVSETQGKLLDTVTAMAKPKEETVEDKLIAAFLPMMADNPEIIQTLAKAGERQGRSST